MAFEYLKKKLKDGWDATADSFGIKRQEGTNKEAKTTSGGGGSSGSSYGSDFSKKYADCTGGWLKIKSAVNKGATSVKFKAFLTDYSNAFSPNWQTEEVFGRNDPIGMFKGTKRNMSLAWDVPASNLDEAISNKGRCNSLAKLLYPSYLATGVKGDTLQSHQQTLAKPPLVRIRFANLIKGPKGGLMGWIEACTIKPALDMGFFSKGGNLYPKVWNVSIGFQVLHEHELGYNSENGSWFSGNFFY